jgi:isoleucyl-tRNA synthetase
MMREVIRNVQQARKAAGLQVDDRISLHLTAEAEELSQALQEHKQTILDETLSVGLVDTPQDHYATTVKVDGAELQISLAKA